MIAGIACGIKKKILIFNTSENLLHDPISVVDPNYFDVSIEINDSTPVVVAYNNYHYESLHPVDDNDRQETIRLVHSYIQGRYNNEYGFTKLDIKYLITDDPSFTRNKTKLQNQECDKNTKNIVHDWTQKNKVEDPEKPRLKRTKKTYECLNSFNQQKLENDQIETEKLNKQPGTTLRISRREEL